MFKKLFYTTKYPNKHEDILLVGIQFINACEFLQVFSGKVLILCFKYLYNIFSYQQIRLHNLVLQSIFKSILYFSLISHHIYQNYTIEVRIRVYHTLIGRWWVRIQDTIKTWIHESMSNSSSEVPMSTH